MAFKVVQRLSERMFNPELSGVIIIPRQLQLQRQEEIPSQTRLYSQQYILTAKNDVEVGYVVVLVIYAKKINVACVKEVRKTGGPILEITTSLQLNLSVNQVKQMIRKTSRFYLAQVVHLVSWMTRGLKYFIQTYAHKGTHSFLRLRSWNQQQKGHGTRMIKTLRILGSSLMVTKSRICKGHKQPRQFH